MAATAMIFKGDGLDIVNLAKAGCGFVPIGIAAHCSAHASRPLKNIKRAGDAFAAGILHGLHESWNAHDCIVLGNKMAAACLRAPTATGGILALKEL